MLCLQNNKFTYRHLVISYFKRIIDLAILRFDIQ